MARGRAVGWWLAGATAAGVLMVSVALLPSGGTAVAVPRWASREPTDRRVDVRGAGAAAMAKLGRSASVKRNAVDLIDGKAHVHTVQPVLGGSFGLPRDESGANPDALEDAMAVEEEAEAIEGIGADREEVALLDEAEASAPSEDLDALPPSPAAAAGGEELPPPPSRTVSTETGAPSLSAGEATAPEAAAVSSMTQAVGPGVAAAVVSSMAVPVTEAPHATAVVTPGAAASVTTPGAVATETRSVTVATDSGPQGVAVSATPEAAAVVAAAKAAATKPVVATAAEVASREAAATAPVAAAAVPLAPVTAVTPEAAAAIPMVETAAGMTAPEAMATATEATTAVSVAPEAVPEAPEAVPVAPQAVPVAPVAAPLAPATALMGDAVLEGVASEAAAAISSVAAVAARLSSLAASSPATAVETRPADPAASSPEAFISPIPEEAPVASTPVLRAAASRAGSAVPAAAAPPPGNLDVTAPLPHAVTNEGFSADSSSMIRLGETPDARPAENSEESVASKLRLLHRISLERDAQAKADHELLPPAEDAIAPDSGTVVDARLRPPIHGILPEREDTTAPMAGVAVPVADDAVGATKNTTDTARAGEPASAATVERTLAVPATTAEVNGSLPTQEAIPVVVKNTIPLSPDDTGDILVMDGEATLAAAAPPPDAAGSTINPARTAAAAEPAGAVMASSAADEVAESVTGTEAAANGAAARMHPEKPSAVATAVAMPSPTIAATVSNRSDRPAATTGPVRASEGAGTMAAAAAAVALDTTEGAGPLPSPEVTPVVPSTELNSAAAAATQEPVPAVIAGQEGLPDPAVTAANASLPANASLAVSASSSAVGTPPLAPVASHDQPLPEAARSYTQIVSRVTAAAIEAAVREATATAWATAAAGPGVSAAATPSLELPPSGDEHTESPMVAPSPSEKVRTAASTRPTSPPTAVKEAQSRRGGKRHRDHPVSHSPPPTPLPAAVGGGMQVVPPEGAAATPAPALAFTGSRGVYLFAGDGSVWRSFAGRLVRVGGDMAMGATATDTALVEEPVTAAEAANPKEALLEGSLGRPDAKSLLLKRMLSPGGGMSRGLPAPAMPHPPTPAALSLGLSQRPAPSPSSSPLSDLPTPVHWHRPATPTTPAVPAVGADASPTADRAAIPWLVRVAKPAVLAGAASGSSSPPPDPRGEGASYFAPAVRVGGACHYNRTSCSCSRRVSSVPPPAHPPTCIRYESPGATAGALPWCTAEPCNRTAPRFVCDCMGGATCGVERKVVDSWRRVRGGQGEGEGEAPAPAESERFQCELRERLITVVTCVDRCG